MAEQQGAAIQSYNNEVVRCLQQLELQRRELQSQIDADEREKAELEAKRQAVEAKLCSVNAALEDKLEKREKYDKAIQESRKAHQSIMESSQVLLNVVKKDLKELNSSQQHHHHQQQQHHPDHHHHC